MDKNHTEDTDRETREAGAVRPGDLMQDVSKSTLGRTIPIAIAVHLVIIALTSIGYIGLCIKHKTWFPKDKVRQIARQEDAKEKEEAQKLAVAAAKAREKERAAASAPADRRPTGSRPAMSPVERRISEVSTSRPAGPTINLDAELDLP